jgi:hypothetical protein
MTPLIQFTRADSLHAAFGVIPAVILVAIGQITLGAAFAIGLLPTSILGIAATRRARIIFGIIGCLFGVGVLVGSLIMNTHSLLGASLIFILVALLATLAAARKPAGGLLLATLIPSLAIGTGYTVPNAAGLMLAFAAGSIWSTLVMLPVAEFAPDNNLDARLKALQPKHVKTYGLLLGLTVATAITLGHYLHIPYAGWIATAAMLIIRPLQQMTGLRGVGRAVSTIAGTLLVIVAIGLGLNYLWTAAFVAAVTILTLGAKSSRLYVTSFGTACLILTIELYGVTNAANIQEAGHYRILNNVLGALIALFYGLLVPFAIERLQRSNGIQN